MKPNVSCGVSWASKRSRPAALAVALLLHAGVLAAVLAPHYARVGPAAGEAAAPSVLTVRLLPAAMQAPAPAQIADAPPRASRQVAAAVAPAEPAAMQEPSVAAGMEGGNVLLVAELAAGNLAPRFWIGADGTVERVELGTHRYSDEDAERVLAALQRVRFHPARRHGLAVPAELTLDVLVLGGYGS